MITLYSYPRLFGVADNNPYGLKVFAFIRLAWRLWCGKLARAARFGLFKVDNGHEVDPRIDLQQHI